MFQIRDILRDDPALAPDGTGTVLADPPEQDQPIQFDRDAPVVTTPFTPAPGTSEASAALSTAAAGGPAPERPPAVPDTAQQRLEQQERQQFGTGFYRDTEGNIVPLTKGQAARARAQNLVQDPATGVWYQFKPAAPAAPTQKRRGPPAARLTQTTTASPNMTSLMFATKRRGESLAALADAQADQDEATAVIYGEMADQLESEAQRLGQMRQQAMEQAQESSAKLQAQADELGATEPQVGRLFGTGAQAAAMGAALSIAAGAMLSVRRGGNNVALSIVQKAIDRDMAAQKLAIQNKQYALRAGLDIAQQMQAAYRDDLTASKAMQATLEKYAVNRLEAITRASNRPLLEAKAQAGIADLNLKFMATLEEVTREKYQLNISGPTARLQNIVASAMGQTLPPMLNPKQADPALTEDAAVNAAGAKRGQSNAARKRGQDARNQGRKIRKDAAPTPSQQFPGFAEQTVQGVTYYTPLPGGDRQPTSPNVPLQGGYYTNQPTAVPPGWTTQEVTGSGPYRYIVTPAQNVRQAAPETLGTALEGGMLHLPVPRSAPGRDPLTGLRGQGKRGGRSVLYVDPDDYGGVKQAQAAVDQVRAFATQYDRFVSLYNEAKELSKNQNFWWNQEAGQVLADQAAGAVTSMAGGGVMGEGEYQRAGKTISNPQDREWMREWIKGESDSEEKGMAGWDQLMDIVTRWRNAGFNRLANGGIGTTGVTPSEPGQASSPVQARRPGS